MPNIIKENRPVKPSVARSLIGGLAEGIPGALSEYQENQALKKGYGLDLTGVRDSNTRQQLIADQLKFGRSMKQAEALRGVNYSNQGAGQQNRPSSDDMQRFVEENRPQQQQELPEFFGSTKTQKNKPEEPPFSHNAQPETKGRKRKVFDPDETIQEGIRIAKAQTEAGLPTQPLEGIQIAQAVNQENRLYNSEVEKDIAQQIQLQNTYGQKAVEELNELYPEATAEHQALARKWGEEAISEGHTSEAAIAKEIAQKTKKFKNTVANAKKSVPAPRLLQRGKEALLGTSRLAEKTRDDIRIKLKPLLDEGLYDTARNILSELGYHPEEREAIISDLGEGAKKNLAMFPSLKKMNEYNLRKGEFNEYYSPEQNEKISQSIKSVFDSDPSTNLVLLRKAYEDKGVDWQGFKDNLNELIASGQIKLNDDQFNHLDLLDYPPLDRLDRILHALNLIGR